MFEVCRRAQWFNDETHRVEFMGHGVVLGGDGKKFRTREGETVPLQGMSHLSVMGMEMEMAMVYDNS